VKARTRSATSTWRRDPLELAIIRRFTSLTATGGSPAVQAQRTVLVGSLITGCSGSAISGGSGFVSLVNTTMTGNVPLDMDTLSKPRLTNSTCEHSQNLANPSQTWGVCSGD
jgi:hypothetical protein